MLKRTSPLILFFATLAAMALLALLGPEERSLGGSVRIVYMHGAWVLTAEIAFLAAALVGLAALLTRRLALHGWSAALGRTGTVFWIAYLPLSLWAMEANWNGLFLAEPRFRLAVTFAVVGALLQIGLWLISLPWLTSLANALFAAVLFIAFATVPNVLHPPPSPIFSSGLWNVILFFIALNFLAWLAAYFLTRWFLTIERVAGPVNPMTAELSKD
jgi:hypothetical protein